MSTRRGTALLEMCLLAHGAVLLVVTMASLVAPAWLGELAEQLLSTIPLPSVISEPLARNYAILAPLSSAEYAQGFKGLQFFALLLEPAFVALVLASLFAYRPPGTHPAVGLIILAAGAFAFWWCFLSGDFYSGHDADFTGMLRPWFGSVIFSTICWLIPVLVSLPVYSLAPRHRDGPS